MLFQSYMSNLGGEENAEKGLHVESVSLALQLVDELLVAAADDYQLAISPYPGSHRIHCCLNCPHAFATACTLHCILMRHWQLW